jgi:hypothetical protein
MPDSDIPFHHTGDPFLYAKKYPAGLTQFAHAKVDEIFDEDLTPMEEDEPTLEEIITHRIKDQVLQLNVKFVDDKKLYWTNISELNDYHPRAVRQYMENNDLHEDVLERDVNEQGESINFGGDQHQ